MIANNNKGSIIFGGVGREVQEEILSTLGFTKGKAPIRFLGVPLSSKRLSLIQCYPLIEKILGRLTSWLPNTCRMLVDFS